MKTFAVGVIDFFNNILNIEIIQAESWLDALGKHSDVDAEFLPKDVSSMEDLQREYFDLYMTFDVKEIEERDQIVCPYCVIKESFDSERAKWITNERDRIHKQNLNSIKGLSNEIN